MNQGCDFIKFPTEVYTEPKYLLVQDVGVLPLLLE